MPDPSIDFATLLCSRLCHDLLSPVGSISNGLELLADEDDPEMRRHCMDLLAESARQSAEKLKFFRLAFGAAGGFGDEIAANDVKAAIEGLVRGNPRLLFGWLVDAPMLSRSAAKIVLNLALTALDALVRGGRLDIGIENEEIVVRAEGPRLVLDAEVRAVLMGEGDAAQVTSRTSAVWLARLVAEQSGGRLMIDASQDGILLLGAALAA